MKDEKRLKFLDCAKGIAILLLILSHCMSDESMLKTWIFSFHMPIFFIVCGILQAQKFPNGQTLDLIGPFLKKRCRQMLLPYFSWGGYFDPVLSGAEFGRRRSVNSEKSAVCPGYDAGDRFALVYPCIFFRGTADVVRSAAAERMDASPDRCRRHSAFACCQFRRNADTVVPAPDA